ncbi:hypothetical protein TPE_1740 [Treponema pedis str. T A4]|uniref:Uncharacterized protein n=1 Tax=Treponema pedis str. T A4 TaxID=1291379 RepID=S6A8Q0_9SPIR|nr:hypothetical protein TPE_1740 [Treponema pedis str. T A4]
MRQKIFLSQYRKFYSGLILYKPAVIKNTSNCILSISL